MGTLFADVVFVGTGVGGVWCGGGGGEHFCGYAVCR